MNHFDEFIKTFKPRLHSPFGYKPNQFNRWASFEYIAKTLFAKGRPINIIETGSLRTEHDWLGYGQATLLWDWIISKTGGMGISVDIDHQAIDFGRARCKKMSFIHCDSVGFLRGFAQDHKLASSIDLLYLDSYDWSKEKHVESCLHHIGELAMIYEILPKDCLIAVDDAHNENEGKHILVRNFFRDILKLQPVCLTHIAVWKKP